MNFFLVVFAWTLFGLGFVNLFAESYEEGNRRINQKNSAGANSIGHIFLASFRLLFIAVCLAGWYWILFFK